MKLYILPKFKELHRSLMSIGAFKQASWVYRYIITGDKKYLNRTDMVLIQTAKKVGINILNPAFDSGTMSFQR